MLGLKGRQDAFRLLLPKNFLVDVVEHKYEEILKEKKGWYLTPIDFLNESIQKVNVLGFQGATIQQSQTSKGSQPTLYDNRIEPNKFQYPASDFNYRSSASPISLTDRTFTITFRHTLGYLNYFMIYENFWYLFSRDMKYKDMPQSFFVDIINERGEIYTRIELMFPIMDAMDMLEFDYTQPIAASQTFTVTFKYSNFDLQFIDINKDN